MSNRGRPVDHNKKVNNAVVKVLDASQALHKCLNDYQTIVQEAHRNGALFKEDLQNIGMQLGNLVTSVTATHTVLGQIYEACPTRSHIEIFAVMKQQKEDNDREQLRLLQEQQAESSRQLALVEARLRSPGNGGAMFPTVFSTQAMICEDDSGAEIEEVNDRIGAITSKNVGYVATLIKHF